jgi:hypothetical protein
MSDQNITKRTLNTLTSYRTSIQAALGHLRGLEETTANTRAHSTPSRPATRVTDTQICEGCHQTGHHYTECLNHTYVWDSTANARLLEPGERLAGPATWKDIHRASLHQLIRTSIQYYIHLHHTRFQDLDTLLTDLASNSEFGDLTASYSTDDSDLQEPPPTAPRNWESPPPGYTTDSEIPSSPSNPGIWLINLAVLTAATRLRVDPWNETQGYQQFIALHHWHPSFGLAFPSFLRLVQIELSEPRLHSPSSDNPFDIQEGTAPHQE